MKKPTTDLELIQLSKDYAAADSRIKEVGKELDSLNIKIKHAKNNQQQAFEEVNLTRKVMNDEFEKMQAHRETNQSKWDTYHSVRNSRMSEIERLKNEADNKARTMKNCFAQSQSSWSSGDRAMAKYHSDEGKKLKSEVDDLNNRVSLLFQEIKNAKPQNDDVSNYAFNNAKARFEQAKVTFENYKAIKQELKAKQDSLKAEIKKLASEKQSIKVRQNNRKATLSRERDQAHRSKDSEWHDLQLGTIDGHRVWFRQHKWRDEILIADADKLGADGEGFDRKSKLQKGRHNHYGKNKSGKGRFVKDRGYYSGPGH